MTNEQAKVTASISWRLFVMLLCSAAVACAGWYVAYEHVIETAFAMPLGGVISGLALSGFVAWVYLAAGTFIDLQHEVKALFRKLHLLQKREQWNRVIMARRERLRIIAECDPNPGNARKTIEAIGRVKG
jgi:hypothetical protein